MKRCTQCGEEKELSEFYFNKKLQYHQSYCRTCAKKLTRKWKEANVERVRDWNRKWAKAHPDRVKAAQDRWRQRNPGMAAQRTAAWRVANLEQAREAQRASNRKLKAAAYAAYGGFRCACCGETEEAFLSLDHINNDGNVHRQTVDRRKIYKWMAANGYPPGFQVLCMNCNFGKARNGGICPHQVLKVQRL